MLGTMDWRRTGALAYRWLTSLAITFIFISALMTATAQQRVTGALDKRPDKLSYSSAFNKVKAAERVKQERDRLRDASTRLSETSLQQRDRMAEADGDLEEAWSEIEPLIARIARTPDCGLAGLPTDTPPHRLTVWQRAADCARNGAVPDNLQAQVTAAGQTPSSNYPKHYQDAIAAHRHVDALQSEFERTQTELAQKDKDVADADSLSAVFDETTVIRDAWYALGSLFVGFPPALLLILLAFISGMFGALLITLVLIVYPKSEFAGAAGQEYSSRLLLGGVISVGVYVLLGGGSAVLGNTDPFGQSQANFMTFSAVGVLAGMFSDRVAAWLSERANAFFSTRRTGQGAGVVTPTAAGNGPRAAEQRSGT
jgi:hypothetical protein